MVLIFIFIYFEWRDTENQQYTDYLYYFHFVDHHKGRKKLLTSDCFSLIFSRQPFFRGIKLQGRFSRYLLGECQECILQKHRMMAGVRLAAVPQHKEGRQVRVAG